MDPVKHPLDWWAYGGYEEVMRHTGWHMAKARREVRKAIKSYGWNPIGHAGYKERRRQIMDGELLNNRRLSAIGEGRLDHGCATRSRDNEPRPAVSATHRSRAPSSIARA